MRAIMNKTYSRHQKYKIVTNKFDKRRMKINLYKVDNLNFFIESKKHNLMLISNNITTDHIRI